MSLAVFFFSSWGHLELLGIFIVFWSIH